MPRADRQPLYYFHGFASAIPADYADSPKISAVNRFCRAVGREFLPLNVDFRHAAGRSREVLDLIGPDVASVTFVGASMGGWFARILQLLLLRERPDLPVDAVAFNPAFNLEEFSHYLEGAQENYVTGERFEFTPEHGRQLVELERSVEYRSATPFLVYVDRGDETINAEWSERYHEGFAVFKAYPGGCHSFDHAREALEDYQSGCWNRTGQ